MKLLTRRARTAAPLAPIHRELGTGARQWVSNLLVTSDGTVLAGYRIGPVRWDFTGDVAKELLLDQAQDGWAGVVGRDLIERVTTRPHPVFEWSQRLDARTPNPLPDVHTCERSRFTGQELLDGACGCETWNALLRRQGTRIATAGMDDKVDLRYFTVGRIPPTFDLRVHVAAYAATGTRPPRAVRELLDAERALADALTVPGWVARRMTEREQAWLRHRSLAPGIPAPDLEAGWRAGDVAAPAASVRWHEDPLDFTVGVTASRGGRVVEVAAQVLTCARLDDLAYPGNGLEPWMVYAERAMDARGMPFPVEWSLNGRVVSGESLRAQSERDLRLAMAERGNYEAFAEPPPEYTERGIERAKSVRDAVTTGKARDAARFVGTVNAVITGAARYDEAGRMTASAAEVAMERAEAFARLMRGADLRMDFVAPPGQSAWLAQAVPGEPRVERGFQRQVPLDYLAAAMPNVSTAVGDAAGPYEGYTRGAARRPVMHDSHYATEGRGALGRGQNLWVAAGTLGAGKSVLLGMKAYQAARRGIRTIVRDPSGPLLRLCSMPELAPYAVAVDVTAGRRGLLNPPALVREPVAQEYASTADYEDAVLLARGERSDLVQDIARRCLQYDLYVHPETIGALREAARAVQWSTSSTLWDLVSALDDADGAHATVLANALIDASTRPLLKLLFAPRSDCAAPMAELLRRDAVLTVIATPGIRRASDATPRADWTPEERAADPVIYLTGLLTTRLVYDKSMAERCLLILDEAEDMTDGSSGRAVLTRLGRDHSKWNTQVILGLKNISATILSEEMRNYLAGAWVGKMATLGPAEQMLDILNIPDRAYARSLMRLSTTVPGEFVHLDADGNVGGMRVDVDYHPALRDVLLTTPNPAGASAWGSHEALG